MNKKFLIVNEVDKGLDKSVRVVKELEHHMKLFLQVSLTEKFKNSKSSRIFIRSYQLSNLVGDIILVTLLCRWHIDGDAS